MDFFFTCPQTGASFMSADFSLTDNQGVVTSASGEKVLQATVVLNQPCPSCGGWHRYAAKDLACPFHANAGNGTTI